MPPAAPPGNPGAYTACFCSDSRVAAFAKGTAGVCDNACTAVQGGLQSIAGWFQSVCKNVEKGDNGGGNNNQPTSTGAPGSSNNNNGGGDW